MTAVLRRCPAGLACLAAGVTACLEEAAACVPARQPFRGMTVTPVPALPAFRRGEGAP